MRRIAWAASAVSVTTAVLLAGCLTVPPTVSEPERASSGASTPRTAVVTGSSSTTPPPSARADIRRAPATRLQAPFAAGDKDFEPTAAVDSRCARAGSTKGLLPYGAGACDAQGNVDGFGAAAFSPQLIAEGVFLAGRFMPGTKYRTLSRYTTGARTAVIITCSDMRPTDYDLTRSGGGHEAVFLSTSATVCKETHEGGPGSYQRKLHGGADGAIFVAHNGTYGLRAEVQQHALLSGLRSRDAPPSTLEIIGTAGPSGSSRSADPEQTAKTGTIRRVFHADVYVVDAASKSGRVCLEGRGPDACVHVSGCTLNPLLDSPSLYQGRPGCRNLDGGGSIRLDDGSVFTPATRHGVGVFYRDGNRRPRGGPKTYSLGDGLDVVPIEGTLKSPDGREYSGRFVNGTPL